MFWKREKIATVKLSYNTDEIRKRIKIVIIDDDENSFPYQLLSSSGYTIEYWDKVDDRRLERLEKNQFDIIILDINDIADKSISSTDGIGILERVKHVNPTQIIIAFSGREYDIETTSFFKMADDTLRKPVDFVKAKNIIDRIIETKITLGYFWESLKILLVKEKVKDSQLDKIEDEIAKAIKNHRPIDYDKIKNAIFKGIDMGSKVVTIIDKFIKVVGYLS